MPKSISCKDAGKDCSWSATAETDDEIMTQVMIHVKREHPEIELNIANITQIKSLIKETSN